MAHEKHFTTYENVNGHKQNEKRKYLINVERVKIHNADVYGEFNFLLNENCLLHTLSGMKFSQGQFPPTREKWNNKKHDVSYGSLQVQFRLECWLLYDKIFLRSSMVMPSLLAWLCTKKYNQT